MSVFGYKFFDPNENYACLFPHSKFTCSIYFQHHLNISRWKMKLQSNNRILEWMSLRIEYNRLYSVTSIRRSHGFSFSNIEKKQQQSFFCLFVPFALLSVYSFWLLRLNFYWQYFLVILMAYIGICSMLLYYTILLTTLLSFPLSLFLVFPIAFFRSYFTMKRLIEHLNEFICLAHRFLFSSSVGSPSSFDDK